ncbi:hypothetical protein BDZ89DRAFT_1053873 [Hymenopellis radicata]|nr:hypothetical protein BDZ89DRAFT_1053873 [Hymenopellis radicata]
MSIPATTTTATPRYHYDDDQGRDFEIKETAPRDAKVPREVRILPGELFFGSTSYVLCTWSARPVIKPVRGSWSVRGHAIDHVDVRFRFLSLSLSTSHSPAPLAHPLPPLAHPFHLLGTFPGPEGTPYERGTFNVDIVIPDSYTFTPVKLKPSPNTAGAIYLDILKDAWSPVLALKSTLISKSPLLSSAERPPGCRGREALCGVALTILRGIGPRCTRAEERQQQHLRVGQTRSRWLAWKRHVDQFEAPGFHRDEVIDVLWCLNYRGKNVAQISEDRVEELLK